MVLYIIIITNAMKRRVNKRILVQRAPGAEKGQSVLY